MIIVGKFSLVLHKYVHVCMLWRIRKNYLRIITKFSLTMHVYIYKKMLCWYGHVEHSNGAVKTAFDIQVDGKRGPRRPKMTWKQLTERDCRDWKLSAIDPHNRHTWRPDARAASQLPGRGPIDVEVALVTACLSNI